MTSTIQASLAALIVGTAGCSSETHVGSALSVPNSHEVILHRPSGPDAVVSGDGQFTIAGKTVTVDKPQKELLARYFASAQAVHEDGFATGMAGARTAMTALGSVVGNLSDGNPNRINKDVEAKASDVQVQVSKLCNDLRELASTQTLLAASLPDFQPYALIDTESADRCNKG